MHRFHLPPRDAQGADLLLAPHESHHAVTVLRVRPGERVIVLDGVGGEFLCEVTQAQRAGVRLRVVHLQRLPPLACQVTLLQAVPRGRTMDLIIQKAVELGVHRIVPVVSERTVAQVDAGGAAAKQAKWQTTAVEATKQCGQAWLPAVEPPGPVAAALRWSQAADLALVASLQPGAQHPRRRFEACAAERGGPPRTVTVWVGPEGDFTPAEMNLIQGAGALPVTLGPLVLRCETAALYCLAIVNYELQTGAAGAAL